MQILVGPVSVSEAASLLETGVDILDIKNTDEGSYGAALPRVTREVARLAAPAGKVVSATLGDLPYKPGTAALAALGAITAGAHYLKVGLYGVKDSVQATDVMGAIVDTCRWQQTPVRAVAGGYADFARFGGITPDELIAAATTSKSDGVMLDTAIKDGKNLFDALSLQELRRFVQEAHSNGLFVVLAGSIQLAHIETLLEISADIIGVRGCVCRRGDRGSSIDPSLAEALVDKVRHRCRSPKQKSSALALCKPSTVDI